MRSDGEESKVEIDGEVEKMFRTGVEVMFRSVLGVGVLRREEKALVCVGGGDSSRWCVVAMVSSGGVRGVVGDCGRDVAKLDVAESSIGVCRSGNVSGRAELNSKWGLCGGEGPPHNPVTCMGS